MRHEPKRARTYRTRSPESHAAYDTPLAIGIHTWLTYHRTIVCNANDLRFRIHPVVTRSPHALEYGPFTLSFPGGGGMVKQGLHDPLVLVGYATAASADSTCGSGRNLYCWNTNPGTVCECCYHLNPQGGCCGDNTCNGGEDHNSCPWDCTVCGDGICGGSEDARTCPQDCTYCGDGICSGNENAQNCNRDCPSWCGDGLCTYGESATNCPQDCTRCGDGLCTGNETVATCPADCNVCGDGRCTGHENASTCLQDCPAVCGDGFCTGNESVATCPADCSVCGDGRCTGQEHASTCPQDCPAVCGDGYCTHNEGPGSCPQDCPLPSPMPRWTLGVLGVAFALAGAVALRRRKLQT